MVAAKALVARVGLELSSAKVADIAPGTPLAVLTTEMLDGAVRAHVSVSGHPSCWVTMTNRKGVAMLVDDASATATARLGSTATSPRRSPHEQSSTRVNNSTERSSSSDTPDKSLTLTDSPGRQHVERVRI